MFYAKWGSSLLCTSDSEFKSVPIAYHMRAPRKENRMFVVIDAKRNPSGVELVCYPSALGAEAGELHVGSQLELPYEYRSVWAVV